ncbi:hypothetical protein [Sphingobium sp. OAS761]|uniref:hypothetical protein n=1 Tax=Sphingobium sp. OAS761 TaxID=2817901 RepID=UPI00209C872D|nr:hypothetical protein [Sphingobium sp. OAS761]
MPFPSDSMAAPGRAGSGEGAARGVPIPALLVVGAFALVVAAVMLTMPFPSTIDELPHFSVIRSQWEHPALFPDWSRYRILSYDDIRQWSAQSNYINHPSLYYLLFAPLMAVTYDPTVFRFVNLLLCTGALAFVVAAVTRRVDARTASPAIFAIIAASFPKAALVGGMVNNDNLAALAGAALFAGVLGIPGAAWWICAGLMVAGWTKLTAFLALSAVAVVWTGLEVMEKRITWRDRMVLLVAVGLLLGALPYVVTLLRTGHVLWVNISVWRVPPADRPQLDLIEFTVRFLRAMVWKWPAAEAVYPFWLALAGLASPLLLAVPAVRDPRLRTLTLAYGAALVGLFALHWMFGWQSYRTLGDLSVMQTRYYNILWPGIALAAASTVGRVMRWRPMAGWLLMILCLSPTMLGGLFYMAL